MALFTLTGLLLFIEACWSAAVGERGVDALYNDLVRRSGPDPNFNVDKYAALGDSFHAGPGAGSKTSGSSWTGSDCYQFSQAVGPQIDGDGRFLKSSPLARGFQFLACTADKIEDMQPQIDKLDGGTNMGTLTIGGNDVYFGSIVNACIYSIYPGKSCDSNKQAARDHMNSQEFKDDLKNLYQKVLDKAPNMNLYILSYPQFFNDQSDQCSHTCFTFGAPCDGHFLTTDIRRDMNSLVDELNGVIKDQVGRAQSHGSGSIQYVETAPYYDGHRFCEDGVTEPDYNNPNIYFYPFTWTRRNFLQAVPNDLPADCPPKNELGDYGERYDCDVAARKKEDSQWFTNLVNNNTFAWDTSGGDVDADETRLFEWAVRMFHPTIAGHGKFRDAVLSAYQKGGVGAQSQSDGNCQQGESLPDGEQAVGSCKSFAPVATATHKVSPPPN